MSSASYTLNVEVVVPAWVADQSSDEDATELALAAVSIHPKTLAGAGWTTGGDAYRDAQTQDLVVPMVACVSLSAGQDAGSVRAVIDPYSCLLEDVEGFDMLSDDAFQDVVNNLQVRNQQVFENKLAA